MARIGLTWVAVAPPTDAVTGKNCAPKFVYATEPYALQGTTSSMDGRVTCQWTWAGTAMMAPGSGVPASFTCSLFP